MKSGFVAILGRPNGGKSTIINGLINRHISIVTDKSQSTRNNIIGVYNDEDTQIVFLDNFVNNKRRLYYFHFINQWAFFRQI